MKLKDDKTTHTVKNFYVRTIWTVRSKDVEWIECKHILKTKPMLQLKKEAAKLRNDMESAPEYLASTLQENIDQIEARLTNMAKLRQFKLKTQSFSVVAKVKPHKYAHTRFKVRCNMTQFPVNLNNATTEHKLQSMTKDIIIVVSWPKGETFCNWEYIALSRVCSLQGLYLFEPIDMNKSFEPSDELKSYFKRIQTAETKFLNCHYTLRRSEERVMRISLHAA